MGRECSQLVTQNILYRWDMYIYIVSCSLQKLPFKVYNNFGNKSSLLPKLLSCFKIYLSTILPKEGHDFGVNKRNAVYDFFIETFGLDRTKLDESKVTIETADALKSFGPDGSLLPANAIRFTPSTKK